MTLPFLRLLLGGVGNDDSTFGLFFFFEPPDDHPIVQWPHVLCHTWPPS
jgi:hypothetical protein